MYQQTFSPHTNNQDIITLQQTINAIGLRTFCMTYANVFYAIVYT
ncbi:MAG: hypothetical protein ACJAZA_000462 [Shewanella psychromarinicola]|jgi:hypothetical protein